MNTILAIWDWQVRRGTAWEPTVLGAPHCAQHAWVKHGKSGYNLKWNVEAVRKKQSSGPWGA